MRTIFTIALLALSVQTMVADDALDTIVNDLQLEDFQQRKKARKSFKQWLTGKKRTDKEVIAVAQLSHKHKSPEVRESIRHELKRQLFRARQKGFLGVRHEAGFIETKEGKAAIISIGSITPGSPAEKAGLKVGDKIVKVDGKGFTLPNNELNQFQQANDVTEQFSMRIKSFLPGEAVEIEALRGEQTLKLLATLAVYKSYTTEPRDAQGFTQLENAAFDKWYATIKPTVKAKN